ADEWELYRPVVVDDEAYAAGRQAAQRYTCVVCEGELGMAVHRDQQRVSRANAVGLAFPRFVRVVQHVLWERFMSRVHHGRGQILVLQRRAASEHREQGGLPAERSMQEDLQRSCPLGSALISDRVRRKTG